MKDSPIQSILEKLSSARSEASTLSEQLAAAKHDLEVEHKENLKLQKVWECHGPSVVFALSTLNSCDGRHTCHLHDLLCCEFSSSNSTLCVGSPDQADKVLLSIALKVEQGPRSMTVRETDMTEYNAQLHCTVSCSTMFSKTLQPLDLLWWPRGH